MRFSRQFHSSELGMDVLKVAHGIKDLLNMTYFGISDKIFARYPNTASTFFLNLGARRGSRARSDRHGQLMGTTELGPLKCFRLQPQD